MAFSYTCLALQRVLIPILLVLAALYRPVGISFAYLLMFFISPFIPVATNKTFKGSVTAYFIILIALSTILLLCHIALQVTIIALHIDALFGSCSFTEQLLRHVGFIDFRNLKPLAIVEWLIPEVFIFITSIATYLVMKKLTVENVPRQLENGEAEPTRESLKDGTEGNEATEATADTSSSNVRSTSENRPSFDALIKISPLFCLATLFFAAVLRPSVPGGLYFIIFLLSGSYWATFKSLQRGFAILLRFVMVVIVIHTLCIVSYQTPWIQQHFDSNNLIVRLIGLEPLLKSSCDNDIRVIVFDTHFKLDSYLSPIVMFFSYYALGLTTKNLIKPRIMAKPTTAFGQQLENGSNKFNRQLSMITSRASKKESWTKSQRLNVTMRRQHRTPNIHATETTPLVRHNTRKTRVSNQTDPLTGNVTGPSPNDIPLNVRGQSLLEEDSNSASLFEQMSYGIISVGGFIYQNSYIFTNILMMAWSIVYHSWLTFVLLLWANVLWMIPNKRKAMMRSSPFIAIYAELLLIAQYIYGMDLNNDELPSKVDTTGINLKQIGLDRPQENGMQPCVPLIVKTSFVLMFWVTLRQFCKETSENRRNSAFADMIAPLQLTVGAASSTYLPSDGKKTSKFLKKAGDVIKNLLVRLWIWLLVLAIFLCAVTGKQMTVFRICYMALFLFFLLVFQSSSTAWVKVMYGFWLFLIFYAMFILILIYTYQFDKFDQYWDDYLNISKTLQTDIGLERYKTKDLFLHLLSPTIIVILTVIQVHYFHKRFIASLSQTAVQQPTTPTIVTSTTPKRKLSKLEPGRSSTVSEQTDFKKSIRDLIRLFFKQVKHSTKQLLKNFKDVFWRFMELHILKAVYIAAFMCSVSEVCVIHIVFVGLCLLGIVSRASVQTFISRIISFIVTVIILAKMIYQIAYLDHSQYDVVCENTNYTGNNAVWFGLDKATPANGGLISLLRKYIIYMVMVTLHAVVTLRQNQMRNIYGTQNSRAPHVLFPAVTRANAEQDLMGMVKYLFNYGFYKFGMEISLITLVTTITYRQDIVAVAYAFWLFVLLCFDRSKCSKLWGIFQCFIAIALLLQYILLVSLPPSLCLVYPWTGSPYSESIQRWAMLPGYLHYNHVSKLIFDFILLLVVNRQKRVFYIEAHSTNDYPGGTNKSVVNDIANLGQIPFENPTHDFLSHVRNYLDVFKNAILCGFYWVTLAVIFLAGTNIADFLALGYLVGAFIFLWHGSDFYLRPIHTIIRRWYWLLTYNVANILIKTCLQMAGCIFMEQLTSKCCWLVHVLGITCASKPTFKRVIDIESMSTDDCPGTTTQVVLVWDAVCFAFLILQLRIFKSHYFCHIIVDTKANNILASRGAEIIEDLHQKQVDHRQEHEREILLKIKRKMEKIRATQQKMLRPIDKPTHFDELSEEELSAEQIVRTATLARNNSYASCQGSGYHTPDGNDSDYEEDNNVKSCNESSEQQAVHLDDGLSDQQVHIELQTDYSDVSLSIEKSLHQMHQQPTPSSDVLTLPLDGFLETNRLSMGSAPNSDLHQYSEGSYEVFSPPPYQPPVQTLLPPTIAHTSCSLNVNVSGGSSMISSNLTTSGLAAGRHQRQSSVNAVSWHETVSVKCAPKETEISEDVPVTLRQKSLHRRHLSMGNASYSVDDHSTLQNGRRRYSNVSWAREQTYMRATARPNSWGPVEYGYPIPGSRARKRKEIKLHGQAVRAGDYYMFEDMDDKFELDIIEDEVDFLEDQDKITESEKKIARRKTLFDVWKDIQSTENRRQLYSRQRSYASAPGSRIGIKNDEELGGCGEGYVRTSTISEPFNYVHRSTSEYFLEHKDAHPTTSGATPSEEPSESRKKHDTGSVEVTEKDSENDIESNPIVRLLEGFLVSLTIRLNRFSRNYRYVNKILAEEKKTLKESNNLSHLGRTGAAAMFNIFKKNIESDGDDDITPHSSNTRNSNNTPTQSNTPQHNLNITEITTPTATTTEKSIELSQSIDQSQQQPHDPHVVDITTLPLHTADNKRVRQEPSSSASLAKSTNNFEFEDEDFTTRDHHIFIEVLISAWYALLSNTDLICYIVVFINQVVNASIISLPLPFMVFLWGTLSLPRPTKTFWVTLIAYTQAVVFIKCIFQFKLIWANYINLPNQPLALAKIFGVELDPNYASYDLLLLLVLFFHRYILKSHGLWKSEYKEVTVKGQLRSEKSLSDADANDISNESALVPAEGIQGDQTQHQDTQSIRSSHESDPYNSGVKRLKRGKYMSSVRNFFSNMMTKPRLPTDVYALMFLCDFINFFVLLFGFTAFGSKQSEGEDGGVQTYLAENKVPIPFLIMLLVQFILIVVDRALYLRKALVNKIIFHFLSVIGIHIWMFFVVPAVTERSFYSLTPPIIFYIIKCFYMLLSSYQIKCGYPRRILGNFLTKGVSMANMIFFKIYMVIPFLYDLRTVLDWVCTDTTMTLFDWLKMEDIFSDIFFIKCSRQMETDFPAIRAQKKPLISKLLMGGTVVLLIVISIWAPLCLFALENAVGQPNIPYEVSVSIRIGPYDPIYRTNNRESTFVFNENNYLDMQNAFIKDKSAITFLSGYDAEDIAAIKLAGNSPSMWIISPPDRERLLSDLQNGVALFARFTYSLSRVRPEKTGTGTVSSEVTHLLNDSFDGRQSMINMLEGKSISEIVVLPNLLPKFIKVLNSGDVGIVHALMPKDEEYRSLVIKVHAINDSSGFWWEIRDVCDDAFHTTTLSKLPYTSCESGIVMYTFNDKKFSSTFSYFAGYGIIGIYSTFVFFISRFFKSFISGQSRKIMFEDLPYVDRVLQLCLDIYLVREALEFTLEEDLFAKLIFLYRSPETMIKWTRPKEETNEDETDNESLPSRSSARQNEPQQPHL